MLSQKIQPQHHSSKSHFIFSQDSLSCQKMTSDLKNSSSNRLITDHYEMYWFDTDTLYIRIYKDVEISFEDAQSIIEFQIKEGVSFEHDRIIHAENYVTISKSARELIQQKAPTVRREAYIIASMAQKILFNMYVKLRSNKNPVKAFDQLDSALAWLKRP